MKWQLVDFLIDKFESDFMIVTATATATATATDTYGTKCTTSAGWSDFGSRAGDSNAL